MTTFCNKFHPGQVIRHKLFDYRGVVVGVDQTFQLSEEWYDEVARSRPPDLGSLLSLPFSPSGRLG